MTDYNDGKWHRGGIGECPVHPKSKLEVIWSTRTFGAGETLIQGTTRVAGQFNPECWEEGGLIEWFRVAKEYREPREWWVSPAVNDVSSLPVTGYVRVREVIE